MKRTLLTAGIFALLSMVYVPKAHYGYRLIFSQEDTSVALFQLMLNVGFAALLGAILATIAQKLPQRMRRRIAVGAVIAIVSLSAFVWVTSAIRRARHDEESARYFLYSLSVDAEEKSREPADQYSLHSDPRTARLREAADYCDTAATYFGNAAKNYRLIFLSAAADRAEQEATKADQRAADLRRLP